eukprot:824057-Prymnesium_polylepis.1
MPGRNCISYLEPCVLQVTQNVRPIVWPGGRLRGRAGGGRKGPWRVGVRAREGGQRGEERAAKALSSGASHALRIMRESAATAARPRSRRCGARSLGLFTI